jgi:hypothetical protein
MVNQKLLDYVKQQRQEGTASQDQIRNTLLTAGWQAADIDEAFKSLAPTQPAVGSSFSGPAVSTQSASNQSTASQPVFSQPIMAKPAIFSQPGVAAAASPKISSFASAPKLNKQTLIIIIAVVVGLLLIGGGVLAYFSYFQSPDRIMGEMFEKIVTIKSLEYTGDVKADLSVDTASLLNNNAASLLSVNTNSASPSLATSTKKNGSLSFNFNGSSDWHNKSAFQGLLAFTMQVDMPTVGDFSLGSEIRTINNSLYVELTKAPNIMLIDLSPLENQWVKIDESNVTSTENKVSDRFSPSAVAQIKAAFSRDKFFKITANLPSETVNGVNTYHYKFIIDREGLRNFIIDVDKTAASSMLTGQNLADFNKQMTDLAMPAGEIWIGKNDLLPYKLSFNYDLKATETSQVSGNVKVVLSAKNFNKSLQVAIPAPVKSPQEIMSGLFGGMSSSPFVSSSSPIISGSEPGLNLSSSLGSEAAKARDAERMKDVQQIQTALEMFYNDTNDYPVAASNTLFTSGGSIASAKGVYLKVIPIPPIPADGSCSTADAYTYTYIPASLNGGSSSYRIAYCLGSAALDASAGLNFAGPAGPSMATIDTDKDGLSDDDEIKIFKTDPLKADTDGDGFNDGDEVRNGYNPNGPGKLQ